METQVQNLRRLIDSGKRENIEMAVQLSTNFKPESKWLHEYAKSMIFLPMQYGSWIALYLDVLRFCQDKIEVQIMPEPKPNAPWLPTGQILLLSISDVRKYVANEFAYFAEAALTNKNDRANLYKRIEALRKGPLGFETDESHEAFVKQIYTVVSTFA